MKYTVPIIALVLASASIFAFAAEQSSAPPASSRLGRGYLQTGEAPDSGKLLPPPPAEGSKALARDKKGEVDALKLQNTPRWEQAKIDADLFSDKATNVMSCAAGRVIGKEETPKTYALLRKAGADFGMSSYPAKSLYQRARPFLGNGKPNCTPEMSGTLAKDGSYPSGHAAIGHGWGIVMAELLPNRRTAVIKRGAAFADSRRICNVHFKSDTEAGKLLAEAVHKALKSNASYQADVLAARKELAETPAVKPDCTAENRALQMQ